MIIIKYCYSVIANTECFFSDDMRLKYTYNKNLNMGIIDFIEIGSSIIVDTDIGAILGTLREDKESNILFTSFIYELFNSSLITNRIKKRILEIMYINPECYKINTRSELYELMIEIDKYLVEEQKITGYIDFNDKTLDSLLFIIDSTENYNIINKSYISADIDRLNTITIINNM